VLDASSVCPAAGYLCQGLEERGIRRVLRWSDDTPVIEVRVPRPSHEPSDVALRMQQAAVRGIRLWNGNPFPVRVVVSDRPADEDFAVRWVPTLGGRQLGRAESRWIRREGVETIEVRELALSTRNPDHPDRALDPGQVALTASHEMGHALGLPHSDSERDVMYPTNTASSLTSRDFRTLQALYALDNGAEIRDGG
jgi:predicted Zn-dependent protease